MIRRNKLGRKYSISTKYHRNREREMIRRRELGRKYNILTKISLASGARNKKIKHKQIILGIRSAK